MRIQDVYEKRVAEAAEAVGLTLTEDKTFGNVGVWHLYDEEFTLVGEVSFNFQHGYSCFKAPGLDPKMGYVKPGELKTAINVLQGYIKAQS